MVLANKRGPGEIAEIERLDGCGREIRVGKRSGRWLLRREIEDRGPGRRQTRFSQYR